MEKNHNQRTKRSLAILSVLGFVSFAFCIFLIDPFFKGISLEKKLPGDVRAFFQCVSFFGHGTGCLIAAALVVALDCRWKALLVVSATALSGVFATVLKVIVGRPRPFVVDESVTANIGLQELLFQHSLHSFPSGHSATAFALGIVLSNLYPRGKPVFILMAVLVGIQRVVSTSHFPSDVIAGAAIGSLFGLVCYKIAKSLTKSVVVETANNPDGKLARMA